MSSLAWAPAPHPGQKGGGSRTRHARQTPHTWHWCAENIQPGVRMTLSSLCK